MLNVLMLNGCLFGGSLHYSKFRRYNILNHDRKDTLYLGPSQDSIKVNLSFIHSCRWNYRYYTALSLFVYNDNRFDTISFNKDIVELICGNTTFKLRPSYTMINEKGDQMKFKTRKLPGIFLIPPKWGIDIPFEFESAKKYTKREYEESLMKDTLILVTHNKPYESIRFELKEEKNSSVKIDADNGLKQGEHAQSQNLILYEKNSNLHYCRS